MIPFIMTELTGCNKMDADKKMLLRKIMVFLIIYVIYYNICYLIFVPQVYFNLGNMIYFILYYTGTLIDTIIRPANESDRKADKHTIILLIFFLMSPFFLIKMYFESLYLNPLYLSFWNHDIIMILGLITYVIGLIIMLGSRIQLGKQASGRLKIQEDHELITSGIYKYLRHPIYLGGLIGVIGFCFVFHGFIIMFIVLALYFITFRNRMLYEEKILQEQFGEKYTDYMKKTKRIIPFIY